MALAVFNSTTVPRSLLKLMMFSKTHLILGLLFSTLAIFLLPNTALAQEETLEGKVTRVVEEREGYQELEVKVLRGSLMGRTVIVQNSELISPKVERYEVGDQLVLSHIESLDGDDIFLIVGEVRRNGLASLFILFVMLAVLIGGKWGVTSVIGMLFSFLVIFKFILPFILKGHDAVAVAIVGAALIIPVTFSLSHGIKAKTLIAAIGTVVTLAITGLIAMFFVEATHLTGFAAEEAGFLQFELGGSINMKGLLLAGIIIASLGILDDITISQAAIVEELKNANHKYGFKKLFEKAMNVGRDHIASLINTLVLVYTGASLPLLLLFINNPRPFSEVINYEIIADEIVRTLVGSIGLILAVPITTIIAAYYFDKRKSG